MGFGFYNNGHMRIDQLHIRNFKGFQEREFSFHPQFNLVVGINGTGKTSLLDALAVALGGWFLGLRGYDTRHIRSQEVLLRGFEAHTPQGSQAAIHWEPQFPCEIRARGQVMGKVLSWTRALNTPDGRTTYVGAREIKSCAAETDSLVRTGGDVLLPLISYYGTGRLWNVPREQSQVKSEIDLTAKGSLSRLSGYRNSVDPRLSVADLVRWIARQSWITYQQGGQPSPTYTAVSKALIGCIEGASDLYFDANMGEVIVEIEGQSRQPFNNLSDGQRSMLAMAGDIAQKAVTLNPHLGESALDETPGVVLIDELDLHLHPKWQRHVIEDLRRIFPRIQFFASTHSPFLIQSLRSGEELVMLDGQPAAQLANMSLEEIAQGIMRIPHPEVSQRYERMKGVARRYLESLEEAEKKPEEKLSEFKKRLADSIAPFADNPAFQAFLEMKRTAKLGE
jgi:predicted ATP-binding protein involved in virulence